MTVQVDDELAPKAGESGFEFAAPDSTATPQAGFQF